MATNWTVNTSKNVVYEITSDNTKHDLKKVIYNGVMVWVKEQHIFDNGTTSDYAGGWSVESGADNLNMWDSTPLTVGTTIKAGLKTGLGNTEHEGINATTWISSGTIDFSGYSTITINANNWLITDGGYCEIAYYIDDTLIESFTDENVLSDITSTFTADISNINSGKLRIKLHIEDNSDYYSSDATVIVYSITLGN